jgi:hypothetical protein
MVSPYSFGHKVTVQMASWGLATLWLFFLCTGFSSSLNPTNWEKQSEMSDEIVRDYSNSESEFRYHTEGTFAPVENLCSSVSNICGAGSSSRIGCCQPKDSRILYNVIAKHGKFLAYLGAAPTKSREFDLPPIKSLHVQVPVTYSMKVEERYSNFEEKYCKSYFNGTLHVIGRTTAHNIYHIGNHYISVVSRILLIYGYTFYFSWR